MAKFIEVAKFGLTVDDTDIEVKEVILLNIENIKWIEVREYFSGYAIIVVTNKDSYIYDCEFEKENEAYIEMRVLKEELNK